MDEICDKFSILCRNLQLLLTLIRMNTTTIRTFFERIPKWVINWLRRGIVATVIGIIVYQIFQIGWQEVLSELPVHPGFYLILAFLYVSLPLGEVLIYRILWDVPKRELFRAFLIKKIYNEEVAGYSGEVFLYSRVRKFRVDREPVIARNIRDCSIISAITSNLIAVVLVIAFLYKDIIPVDEALGLVNFDYVVIGFIVFFVLAGLAYLFRKHIFALPFPVALRIFAIYVVRFGLHHVLLVFQWSLVMPEVPWSIWLIFVSLLIVMNRIPLLPGKEMMFVWAGIELSRVLDVATAGVAGMLIVAGALTRLVNLAVYVIINRRMMRDAPRTTSEA